MDTNLDISRPHVSRIVMLFRPENFESAIATFSAALGIVFAPAQVVPALGLRFAASLASGLEILAPYGEEGHAEMLGQELDRRGEHILSFVFNVGDLDAGEATARAAGFDNAGARLDSLAIAPAWTEHYARMMESLLPPIAGINVALMDVVTRENGSASTLPLPS